MLSLSYGAMVHGIHVAQGWPWDSQLISWSRLLSLTVYGHHAEKSACSQSFQNYHYWPNLQRFKPTTHQTPWYQTSNPPDKKPRFCPWSWGFGLQHAGMCCEGISANDVHEHQPLSHLWKIRWRHKCFCFHGYPAGTNTKVAREHHVVSKSEAVCTNIALSWPGFK